MSIDVGLGANQHCTAEMVNKWRLLPLFIHVLQEHKMNKSVIYTARDPNVHHIILYSMRHHAQNFGNQNLSGQACKSIVDKLPKIPCLALGECQIIPALLYLTDIDNAALSTIHYCYLEGNDQPLLLGAQNRRLKED